VEARVGGGVRVGGVTIAGAKTRARVVASGLVSVRRTRKQAPCRRRRRVAAIRRRGGGEEEEEEGEEEGLILLAS
jgi:hypothetical protein